MIVIDVSPLTKMQRGLLSSICIKVTPSVFVTACSMKIIKEYLVSMNSGCVIYFEAKNTILSSGTESISLK